MHIPRLPVQLLFVFSVYMFEGRFEEEKEEKKEEKEEEEETEEGKEEEDEEKRRRMSQKGRALLKR